MPDFEAFGRDVPAAADSLGDTPLATAVKQLWVWAGLDNGENPNHLWKVAADRGDSGFVVQAVCVAENVYQSPVFVAPPATPEELRQSEAESETAPSVDSSPVAVAPVEALQVDPEPADPAPDVAAADPAPAPEAAVEPTPDA